MRTFLQSICADKGRGSLLPFGWAQSGRGSRACLFTAWCVHPALCCSGNRGWVAAGSVGNVRCTEDPVPVGRSFAVTQFPRNTSEQAMGSKKKEIPLQVSISTQELWEEMLSAKGLTVVDVYQGWCGPCKPVVSLFQKMRMEAGLDLLHFALAEADCLDVLEKYRGRCEPTFLFYAGGELVALVRGANAPLLQETILDQLEAEKKVLAEGRERKVVRRSLLQAPNPQASSGQGRQFPSIPPLVLLECSGESFIECLPRGPPGLRGQPKAQ
nr:thioredoxin domain-containing protein 6 isoform X1 [Manis javanica]